MKDWHLDFLVDMGGRLVGPAWERAVVAAGRENVWFTSGQVSRAVAALRGEMLVPDRLVGWMAGYRKPEGFRPRRVGIVMAGNLPLVGFADLAAVVAVGHTAVVKISSKDRPLMGFVIGELRQMGCDIETVDELEPGAVDAVIATGGDAARDHFERVFAGVPALLRGSRQSVAVLTGEEQEEELRGLAEDMFLYWGLGCRSVVRLFVPRCYDLGALGARLSFPGDLSDGYRGCYRYARAMAAMGHESWVDGGFFVLRRVGMGEGPVAVRMAEVLSSEYRSMDEVSGWLSAHEPALQCVASAAGAGAGDFPRRVALGQTQRPRWQDYADGVDTVAFLLDL